MRKRMIKAIIFLLVAALSIALLEGLCSAFAYARYGTLDVVTMNAADTGNSFITQSPEGYASRLMPHPYLTFVHSDAGQGNNVGMVGRDYPLERDPDAYTILLTGGSVAWQLGHSGELEKALNDRYDFGKPLHLLVGAGGSYHQPQQAIVTLLYGEVCDAVVTLDGFNEHHLLTGIPPERLEIPPNHFTTLNPVLAGGFDALGAAWQTNRLRQFALSQNSRAIYFTTKAIRDRIESSVAPDPGSLTKLEEMYSLPKEWSPQKRGDFNLAQYEKYMRLMHAMCSELEIKEVHFIQPAPAVGKTLTDDEKRLVGRLDYGDVYRHMEHELLSLKSRQIPVVSLLNCFETTKEAVYADTVHCDPDGPGYRILAERMAKELALQWNIKSKQESR